MTVLVAATAPEELVPLLDGHPVERATSLAEVSALLQRLQPACLLLSTELLPDLEPLRAWRPFACVLLTPTPDPELTQRALRAGAVDCLARAGLTANALQRAVAGATARRELERRLAAAQQLEVIGRMTGALAHDFNNLLGVVIGQTDLARRLLLPGHPARALLEDAEQAATKAVHLARSMLRWGPEDTAPLRPLDLRAELEGLATLIDRAAGPEVELDLRLPPLAALALVDPSQLQRALLNLVINARDAMPDGGTLTVALERRPELPEPRLVIRVHDEGEGIPPELQAEVFEPFFTTKPDDVGTGLGLTSVRRFAQRAGGELHLESEVGQGTTVEIVLPEAKPRA